MDKNTVQEVDFHDIIEGIRPDAPPDLSRQKKRDCGCLAESGECTET